jgi:hypothetical protein
MDIDWKAPFEFAFELGLFMVGAILVLAIVFISVLLVFGLIKGFFGALNRARKKETAPDKPKLKTVQ